MMRMFLKVGYGIFVAAVVAIGLLLLTSVAPIPAGIEVKIVQSGSMEPAIKTGAIVFVRSTDTYVIGDVIMFGEDSPTDVPTTHRIVSDEIRSGVIYYRTMGDANEDPDPQPVTKDDIIGKVFLDIPYLGYVIDFAKKPLGFALLIGVPAATVIFDEIGKIWKEAKSMRAKKDEEEPLDDAQDKTSTDQ